MDPNYLLLAACFLLTFRIGRCVLATVTGISVLMMITVVLWPAPHATPDEWAEFKPQPADHRLIIWDTPTFAERWASMEQHP